MTTRFLLLALFVSVFPRANAQTAPYSGATWYFEYSNPIWFESGMEKWEYIGDSVAADGIYRKMHVTNKIYNWFGGGDVEEMVWEEWFRYSGDTIWQGQGLVANFAAQVGDTMPTPYYNDMNLSWLDNPNCEAQDTSIVFQYGTVTATGIDMVDGVPARSYTLSYMNEYGDPVNQQFNERTILESDYWYHPMFYICNAVIEGAYLEFRCYRDDSTSAECDVYAYQFEHLGLSSEEIVVLGIYPNPVVSELTVDNPLSVTLEAEIVDLSGRKALGVVLGSGTTQVDVSRLSSGVYVLRAGGARNRFVKR